MDILFKDARMRRICNKHQDMVRKYGPERAKKLRRRLDELRSSPTLADFTKLPGPRCHALKGPRAGKVSADLDGPYRLIFEVATEVHPKGSATDWDKVTAVKILEVEDTHD